MGLLSRLFRRRAWERQLDAELRFHFDEQVRELIAAGKSPSEARRAARHELGGIEQVKERVRDGRGSGWVEDWWKDTRFALRGLRREPEFTAVAVLTLGLGIGAATAIFSVAYPVLLEPLAYPDSNRIMLITDRTADGAPVTFGTYRELTQRARAFAALSVFRSWRPAITGQGGPERLDGQRVSADYFRVLGVAPALGRGFDRADDRRGGPAVVILSDGLWRRRFAADATIVGRPVSLDERSYTVVGVMPRGFENVPAPGTQAWSLLQYDASLPSFDGREWGRHLDMVGRLLPGLELGAARREVDEIATTPRPDFGRPPWADMAEGLALRRLKETATSAARPLLFMLIGAVALLLGIAWVNVTNLVLGRGARRRGELAMRAALGASRGRLTRQLLAESLALAGLGGMLGLVVAQLGVVGLQALGTPGLARLDAVHIDGAVFLFAVSITTLFGVAVGLAPAMSRARGRMHGVAGEVSHRVSGSHLQTRRVLVVAEVAFALVLLIGAGLLLGSLQRLFAIAPGFEASNAVVMQVQISGQRFGDDDTIHQFFERALEAVRTVPGVGSAALASQLPLSGDLDIYGVRLEDRLLPEGESGAAYRYVVSPSYFTTMGIPLVRGRVLEVGDTADAMPAVVISESLATRLFADRDPIDQRMHVGRTDLPWYRIVGVVGDVKQASLDAGPANAVYLTPEQWYFADPALWLIVSAEGEAAIPAAAIKEAIWSVDRNQPISRVNILGDLIVRSEAQRRFALTIFEVFAALAWVLAGIGLYGVVSGSVTERMHELGVRSALGASPHDNLSLVVRQGMTITSVGIGIGLVAAALASGTLDSFLFGVSRLDAATYFGMASALAAVSAFACWLPARRAARVDPVSTLRTQ